MSASTASTSSSSSSPSDLDSLFRLRASEPDVLHSMVKMHLSFLLDLSTDDCDCSFVMPLPPAAAASDGHAAKDSIARRIFTPKKKSSVDRGAGGGTSAACKGKGVMDGAALTEEGVCQASQLIDYLSLERSLEAEGVFRKHGNLRKQHVLKERMNRGALVNLGDGEFSVHEVAAVLKSFLAELPEPLLTDACYKAHCQVARLCETVTEESGPEIRQKCLSSLQLLLLLLPYPNYKLLRVLMSLLNKVAAREERNKMSASNLGTMFAPLILCPRKLSAESLQSNHQLLTKAVAHMIERADDVFRLPDRLRNDVEMYLKNRESRPRPAPASPIRAGGVGPDGKPQSPVVNTMYSFVDREKTSKASAESSTEAALAALYAHVQAMPESAQKRKLVAKLNDANGQGTPGVVRAGNGGFRKRNEGLKSLLTPKRSSKKDDGGGKIGRHGSYNLQVEFKTPAKSPTQLLHTFRRQKSENAASDSAPQPSALINQKLLSPQSSPALLVSPSAIDTIVSRQAESTAKDSGSTAAQENLDGSYVAPPSSTAVSSSAKKGPPPVPERVSSLNRQAAAGQSDGQVEGASPISSCAKTMPTDMQRSIMTPRSRRPVHAATLDADGGQLTPPRPPPPAFLSADSPCTSNKYNEDEPEPEDKEEKVKARITDDPVSDEELKSKNRAYTSRSLQTEFRAYLEANDMKLDATANGDESSVLDCSTASSVSREADRILSGEMQLSDSMRAVLDGEQPDRTTEAMMQQQQQPMTPSVLDPVDVDSALALSDITEEDDVDVSGNDKENDASYVSARSHLSSRSSLPAAAAAPCRDIPLPAFVPLEQKTSTSAITISYPNEGKADAAAPDSPASAGGGSAGGHRGKSRKRRSLTEISELNPLASKGRTSSPAHNIYFETDL